MGAQAGDAGAVADQDHRSRRVRAVEGAVGADAHRRDLADSTLATRLTNSATIVGLDWESAWQRRTWTVSGVLAQSQVRGEAEAITRLQRANYRSLQRPDATHLTYDPLRTALRGHYGALTVAKTAGERLLSSVTYEETAPGFEANDVGFQFRSDFRTVSTSTTYRNPLQSRLSREYTLGIFTTLSDNFGGERIEERISWNAGVTLLNFWELNAFGSFSPQTVNDRLLRGGPLARRPSALTNRFNLNSDPRKPVRIDTELARTTNASGERVDAIEVTVDWRPLPQARVRLGPAYDRQYNTGQYVQREGNVASSSTVSTARYVFADVRQQSYRLDARLDWTFSPWLSLQLFMQPFAASGRFSRFKEFTTPRRFEFAVYGEDRGVITESATGARIVDPDGTGPATAFTIPNQDFTVRALRGNAVLRWEYSPGSALFLVWSQQREQAFDDARGGVIGEATRTFADPGRHVFLVKFSRWIGR
jgi:hypothetical protein